MHLASLEGPPEIRALPRRQGSREKAEATLQTWKLYPEPTAFYREGISVVLRIPDQGVSETDT